MRPQSHDDTNLLRSLTWSYEFLSYLPLDKARTTRGRHSSGYDTTWKKQSFPHHKYKI